MKMQRETIGTDALSSFHMMFNPRLNDRYYWHFHPEYELVYIAGASATRHVGDHISTYRDSDLVLIGSDIPHLNFDYGVQTEYQKVVVHFNLLFIQDHVHKLPEFQSISRLFERSFLGLAFEEPLKSDIGRRLIDLEQADSLRRYLELIGILYDLSLTSSVETLHDGPYANPYFRKERERIRRLYAHIDKHHHRNIGLDEMAEIAGMTREAFCRYFKRISGISFITYLNRYRVNHAKLMLLKGKSISDTCYSTGFTNLSYFNRVFKEYTGMGPRLFVKMHLQNTR